MLTVKDVCERLDVSQRTVYRLLQTGKLPAKRIGGQWRFEQRDVERLLTYKTPAKYIIKPGLMTLKEVCEYLGLSRFTIYRLVESKKLPAVKSSGRWQFLQSEVRQFLTRSRDVPGNVLGMYFVGGDPATYGGEGGVMTLSQVAQSLGVNRRTVHRLIREGKLPATKVAGVWRFIRTEVSRYLLDRKYSYGTTGVKGVFFWSQALDKYHKRKDLYYIKDSAYDGFVGSNQDYHDAKTLKSIHAEMPGDKFFAELHYRKVSIRGGFILALTPKQYEGLPTEEYVHWSGFRIPKDKLRPLKNLSTVSF